MKRFLIRLWLWLTSYYCWKHTNQHCKLCLEEGQARRERLAQSVRPKVVSPVLLPEWEPVVMNKLHE